MQVLTFVQAILPLLPTIRGDITALIEWISGTRTALQQTGEWDDATEQAYRNSLLAMANDPSQQPDAPQAVPGPLPQAPA